MSQRAKFKKVAITAEMAVAIFAGLIGFAANSSRGDDGGSTAGVGLLFGMLYLGAMFVCMMLIFKLFEWVIFGFDGDDDDEVDQEAIGPRRFFRKVATIIIVIAAFSCGISVGLFPLGQYRQAKKSVEIVESQEENFEGDTYLDHVQRMRAQDNYWLNLSRGGLLGLCVLGWLFGTVFSFLGIWFVYLFFERFILNLCGVTQE